MPRLFFLLLRPRRQHTINIIIVINYRSACNQAAVVNIGLFGGNESC